MSLITRCPACGTMFRVVTDQLKVSQGWVRCGHCTEVFDASLHFQAAPVPFAHSPEITPEIKPEIPPAIPPDSAALTELKTPVGLETPVVFLPPTMPVMPVMPVMPAVSVVQSLPVVVEPLFVVQPPDAVADIPPAVAEKSWLEHAPVDSRSAVSPAAEATPDDEVSFVRDSRRHAFWRKPLMRGVLGLTSLLLVAVLLAQISVQQRDKLAAMEPRVVPWLNMLCEPLQCEIAPLRHIEAVVIDSSSFNKITGDSYRLSFTLKNTGALPVAMPSLEVSLTDSQEQAVIRRVVLPDQLGVTDGGRLLNAGADFSGVVVMQVLGTDAPGVVGQAAPAAVPLRVAGYRVLAFYP